jgi:MFS family permease
MVLFILPNLLSAFMPVSPGRLSRLKLNVCRGFVGAGAAVLIPAAAGMIGSIYPPGKKRTFAFIAVSCGKSPS